MSLKSSNYSEILYGQKEKALHRHSKCLIVKFKKLLRAAAIGSRFQFRSKSHLQIVFKAVFIRKIKIAQHEHFSSCWQKHFWDVK